MAEDEEEGTTNTEMGQDTAMATSRQQRQYDEDGIVSRPT